MAHLTISFTSEGLLNNIASACTDEWPGGLASIKNKTREKERREKDIIVKKASPSKGEC